MGRGEDDLERCSHARAARRVRGCILGSVPVATRLCVDVTPEAERGSAHDTLCPWTVCAVSLIYAKSGPRWSCVFCVVCNVLR